MRGDSIVRLFTGSRERGDTLIEVLLATAILSTVIVGAVTMMNRGHAIALNSLERSQVTAFMTEQSEMLQYARDHYADASTPAERSAYPASVWSDLVARAGTVEASGCQTGSNPFYLRREIDGSGNLVISVEDFDVNTIDESSSSFVDTYAKPNEGLWIEAEKPTGIPSGQNYLDFHIKGCWDGIGDGPLNEAKTIVRLYEPNFSVAAAPAVAGPAVCSGTIYDIVLVLDASGSMNTDMPDGGKRIDRLKTYVSSFINDTNVGPVANHESVISFNDDVVVNQGLSSDEGVLQGAVSSIVTASDTNYLPGLNAAIDELSSVRARNIPAIEEAVVFVSDGEPDDSLSAIYSKTDSMKASGIKIYTVGIAPTSQGANILRNMASSSSNAYTASTASGLSNALSAISDELDCV